MSGSSTAYKPITEKGENKMLFMTIFTWEPEKRDEMVKRFAEKGTVTAGKRIGAWSAIGGGRAFALVDADDPKAMVAVSHVWNDIAKMETIPVIETQELVKLVASKK
jgi:hypothetical protein